MTKILDKYIIKEITQKSDWNSYIKEFSDANIYQTWNYSKFAQEEKTIQHIGIFKDYRLIAIAGVRIKTIPFINRGISYIYRGPLWQIKGQENDPQKLYDIFQILKSEFVIKRKLILRIRPFIFSDQIIYNKLDAIDGFHKIKAVKPYRSLILYLDKELDEIKKQLNHRWRRGLNKAERKGLTIQKGTDLKFYPILIDIYHQMHSRKKYKEYVNVERVGKMNESLDEEFKLVTFVAYKDEEPIAALTGSALGDTGIGLLGGITERAMKCQASYLLQWEIIKYFKNAGCNKYDLGGIDPKKNQSVYYFKQGISDIEVSEIGIFESNDQYLLRIIIKIIERLKKIFSV